MIVVCSVPPGDGAQPQSGTCAVQRSDAALTLLGTDVHQLGS